MLKIPGLVPWNGQTFSRIVLKTSILLTFQIIQIELIGVNQERKEVHGQYARHLQTTLSVLSYLILTTAFQGNYLDNGIVSILQVRKVRLREIK